LFGKILAFVWQNQLKATQISQINRALKLRPLPTFDVFLQLAESQKHCGDRSKIRTPQKSWLLQQHPIFFDT
jgi:hypothetical protein